METERSPKRPNSIRRRPAAAPFASITAAKVRGASSLSAGILGPWSSLRESRSILNSVAVDRAFEACAFARPTSWIFWRRDFPPRRFSKKCQISRLKIFRLAFGSPHARSIILYWSRDHLGGCSALAVDRGVHRERIWHSGSVNAPPRHAQGERCRDLRGSRSSRCHRPHEGHRFRDSSRSARAAAEGVVASLRKYVKRESSSSPQAIVTTSAALARSRRKPGRNHGERFG